ncbi:hypothetical protein [Arsenophonus apicola]|uniref:Uncharacterized protein n=1 Tax=Arsenophonus apicola TaxID=2879119 RepID=A0ABY8P562_9GAMM|nr:hypothetical protein [Arsenophonus apicola]WGO84367.1 hypothetical protein QG404_05610 [Arsenophonus apicola]
MINFSRYIEYLRFKYSPRIASWLIYLSTYRAQFHLKANGPIGVLVDNTVLAHATTHKTAWVSMGQKLWGKHSIETGYLARIPVHPVNTKVREYDEIVYLPGLIFLQKAGLLTLYSSAELYNEQFYQPLGRFRRCGYFDYNLFENVLLESIDGNMFSCLGSSWMRPPDPREQLHQLLKKMEAEDPEYASLVAVLGKKNSQDAWHIRTAEKYNLFCFLTMDFKLIKTLNAQRNSPRIRALKTSVMTLAMLGKRLRLFQIAPLILSYNDATFPVRNDFVCID